MIAALEKEEFQRVGEANYKPSEIMTATSQLVEKRETQLYSVGFVAVSYIWLHIKGFRPSLNRASILASHAIFEFDKVSWRPGLDPAGEKKAKPVSGDPATIERTFRKYRSVAHICAARVSSAEYLDDSHIWDQTPDVVAAMIYTSAAFQAGLERATDVSQWNIWDIRRHFPSKLAEAPLLVPDNNLLYWVERGYALAVENGAIWKRDGGGSTTSPG